MKSLRYLIILLISVLYGQQILAQDNFDLIPLPQKITLNQGYYDIPANPVIYVSEGFENPAELIRDYPGIHNLKFELLKKSKKVPKEGIRIIKAPSEENFPENQYILHIDEKGILIKAKQTSSLIPALYTIIQLGYLQQNPLQLHAADIIDEPRFSYRGLHLDVSRHFMPVSFLKKLIDIMAFYKYNIFHWHLTDGAGWRLEINKYPLLTQKAAWRTFSQYADWVKYGKKYVSFGDPNASGGFYTQNEVKDFVDYAAKKGITVIPEIEMPGHSEEVLAVYPQLSCSGKPYTQSEFCIGNDSTFVFIKDVLDEVLQLFPSRYIHIGGDEADKSHWKNCPKDQQLMREKGIKNVDELQSYAIRQIDEYLQSKGRVLIGWDEILDGGLTKGATVMSWRGESGGIKAANANHDVIMTPEEFMYFDKYQADPRFEPYANGGYIPLEKVYSYNPVSEKINKDKTSRILGAQANIWTEYMPTSEQVEFMAFPRALALSEVNWTAQQTRNWVNFEKRLQSHYAILQRFQLNYRRPSYNIAYKIDYNKKLKKNTVSLSTEQKSSDLIKFTIDGSRPTAKSSSYASPFDLANEAVVKAAYFLDSVRMSPYLEFRVDNHKAIGKQVQYINSWDSYSAQGDSTLTNGIFGGITYTDGQWQGFTKDVEVIVDMERPESINSVAMNFMQLTGPGIYMPGELKVYVSDNGRTFRNIGTVKNDIPEDVNTLTFKRFELKLNKTVQARYIKLIATNVKKGFLFTDEIIVY